LTAHYRHLSLADRVEIEKLLEKEISRAQIARRIGVHPSTITREIRRGSWQPEHDHANLRPYLRNKLNTRGRHVRLYLAGQAQLEADER
jgi:IS30 family transposase